MSEYSVKDCYFDVYWKPAFNNDIREKWTQDCFHELNIYLSYGWSYFWIFIALKPETDLNRKENIRLPLEAKNLFSPWTLFILRWSRT